MPKAGERMSLEVFESSVSPIMPPALAIDDDTGRSGSLPSIASMLPACGPAPRTSMCRCSFARSCTRTTLATAQHAFARSQYLRRKLRPSLPDGSAL